LDIDKEGWENVAFKTVSQKQDGRKQLSRFECNCTWTGKNKNAAVTLFYKTYRIFPDPMQKKA